MIVNPRGDDRGDHDPRDASVHRTRPGAGRSDPRAGATAQHREYGTADRLPRSRRLQRDPSSRYGGESDLRLLAAAQACYRWRSARRTCPRLPRRSSRADCQDEAFASRFAPGSVGEELTQDVRQDPAVPEVGRLGRGVDPDGRGELTGLPTLVDQDADFAGQLCVRS